MARDFSKRPKVPKDRLAARTLYTFTATTTGETPERVTLERFPPRGGSRLVNALPVLGFVVHRLDQGVTATLTLTTV